MGYAVCIALALALGLLGACHLADNPTTHKVCAALAVAASVVAALFALTVL